MCKAHKRPDHLHGKLKLQIEIEKFQIRASINSYNLLVHDPTQNETK